MHLSNKRAFTLAELLTAVLVISVIMVALAPVITKRMKDTVSVQTDNRKGLEIYTNPGTYTFDVPIGINTLFIQGSGGGGAGAGSTYVEKDISFTSTTNWTIPAGVNEVTLKITGSGGGGGGGYGRKATESCKSNTTLFAYLSDSNKDMCISKPQVPTNAANWGSLTTVAGSSLCTASSCCWKEINSITCSASPSGGVSGCKRTVCTYPAAETWCTGEPNRTTFADTIGLTRKGRLITKSEMQRILDRNRLGAGGMDVCKIPSTKSSTYNISKCAVCNMTGQGGANGSENSYGYPSLTWLNERYALSLWENVKIDNPISGAYAYGVFCAYDLNNWFQYSGAGGASGAVMEKTINVLPKDVFEITIGSGGNGGAARTKGSQGGTTKIVHKRSGVELGTYYVKGGLGGNGASTTANGEAYDNGTSTSQTTPLGTCYSRNRKDTTDSFSGGNATCKVISYSGESGTELQGGNGGKLKNEGVATQGGIIGEMGENVSSGKNATEYAFGGGGGTCARGVRSASSCSKGGKGASGRVDIVYKVALPGGGGGSASRVAGVDSNNKMYEIKYKVAEGDRIVFKVGSGGTGGVEGQDGLNGSATVIGDNDIVFLGGEGGKVATESDKSSLRGGRGGSSGCVNEEDNIQSITSGIKIKNSTTTKYSITPSNGSFKGQAGRRGGVPSSSDIQSGYSINNTVFAYGFSGGMGGSPFNVESSKIGASITCSGGIYGTLGQMTSIKYLCTSGNIKGNDARSHDPVNNEFGGSGGGGGGVVGDSFEQGSGGNGSSGYLRIRWDMSEQE